MNLSLNRLKNILNSLDDIDSQKYGYLTPSLVSQKAGISQSFAKFLLEIATKSNFCKGGYLLRSPYDNGEKTFGPYDSLDEIPNPFDPQSYDQEDFEVTEDLIEKVYRLYES